MAVTLFGFTLGKKDIVQVEKPEQASFSLPTETIDDGAVTITQNAHYGTYVDLEGSIRNELELITRYREMSNHPECDMAIDEIVNEAITHDTDGKVMDINLDNLKQPESIKKKIIDEFETIEEAQTKVGLLMNEDPSGRIYKVVQKNEDGTFSDI